MNFEAIRTGTQELMDRYESEPIHVLHVRDLALQIFDGLALWHALKSEDRAILEAAASLHDIGWAVTLPEGRRHHKESARLIQEHAWAGADHSDVVLTSLVARYHRRSLPHEEHSGYGELSPGDKARVRVLAGILRVADALDRRHLQRVCDVKVELTPKKLTFLLDGMDSLEPEIAAAKKKGDLLRQEFGGEVTWVAV